MQVVWIWTINSWEEPACGYKCVFLGEIFFFPFYPISRLRSASFFFFKFFYCSFCMLFFVLFGFHLIWRFFPIYSYTFGSHLYEGFSLISTPWAARLYLLIPLSYPHSYHCRNWNLQDFTKCLRVRLTLVLTYLLGFTLTSAEFFLLSQHSSTLKKKKKGILFSWEND